MTQKDQMEKNHASERLRKAKWRKITLLSDSERSNEEKNALLSDSERANGEKTRF